MFKKLKCKLLCTALVLSGIIMSGCDSSSAELVDDIIAETTVLLTFETTKDTDGSVSESTTATMTEATTTKIKTEVTAKPITEANTEVLIPTVTTTEIQTETTTELLPETAEETSSATATEITAETTTEKINENTQPFNLMPEELEVYNSMPDIVFVLSHCYMSATRYSKYTNIRGFYITKDGEVKLYAFSDDEERKYIDVAEVYDELKNVTCSELVFRSEEDEITQDDLDTVPISYLIELYDKLLLADEKSEFEQSYSYCDVSTGIYELYGIRTNKNSEKEIILLSLRGDYYLTSEDLYTQEISEEVWNCCYPFSRYRVNS